MHSVLPSHTQFFIIVIFKCYKCIVYYSLLILKRHPCSTIVPAVNCALYQQCAKSSLLRSRKKTPEYPDVGHISGYEEKIRAQTVVWPMPDLSDEFVADTQEACARIIAKTTHSDVQVASSLRSNTSTRMSTDVTRCAVSRLALAMPCSAFTEYYTAASLKLAHPLFFVCERRLTSVETRHDAPEILRFFPVGSVPDVSYRNLFVTRRFVRELQLVK